MPRPALPTGTHGKIRFQRNAAGDGWRARTQFRDWDGVTRYVERTGVTKTAAQDQLKIAVRDRVRLTAVDEISPDTRVSLLAEEWFRLMVAEGKVARTTLDQYRRILDRFTIDKLGRLYVRELSPGRLDRHQEAVTKDHGASVAKLNRTVLSGVCGLAVRRNALTTNPVRDLGVIRRTVNAKAATSLTIDRALQLRKSLAEDKQAIDRDVPDLVAMMLATSVRIGECLAIRWADVDLESGIVGIRGNVVRIKKPKGVHAEGLRINGYESSKLKHRDLRLPTWAVTMLRNRQETATTDMVFPAVRSRKLRDPSNTAADLRDAFTRAGVEDLTSHVFRKTVATLMDEQGRTSRNQADQLGHSKVSMTQDRYQGRRVTETGAAEVLESLAL